jgi:hypothetical protein
MTVEEMERELIKLNKDERSRIYYFLMGLVDDDGTLDKTNEITEEEYDKLWAEECKRRVERFERGETRDFPAEEVFARATGSDAVS